MPPPSSRLVPAPLVQPLVATRRACEGMFDKSPLRDVRDGGTVAIISEHRKIATDIQRLYDLWRTIGSHSVLEAVQHKPIFVDRLAPHERLEQ